MGELRGERDSITPDAEEHESIAADLRGRATRLGDEISNLESVLDQ